MAPKRAPMYGEDQIIGHLKELLRLALDEECRELVDVGNITPDTTLTSLMLDSLATVELVYGIETTFGIYLSEEETFEFGTVSDVVRAIQARLMLAAQSSAEPGMVV